MTTALDHFVAEKPDAYRVVVADSRADRTVDFKRQPHTILTRAAVAVSPCILRAEERRHRVRVGVVKLDSIETGLMRSKGGGSEDIGQHFGKLADVRQVHVGDALAIAEAQRFKLALIQHSIEKFVRGFDKKRSNIVFGSTDDARVASCFSESFSMPLL